MPEDLELTPLILAVWFADDGCIRKEGKQLIVKLSTESFGEYGASFLSNKLETRLNEKFPIYRKKPGIDQFFIKSGTRASQMLLKDIQEDVVRIGMLRKYDVWKDSDLDSYTMMHGDMLRIPIINELFLKMDALSSSMNKDI